MDANVRDAVEKVNKSVADFRAANDKMAEDVKKNGHATAETRELVDRLNARVTDLLAQVDEVQKQAQRRATGGGQDGADPRKVAYGAAFQAFMRSGDVTSIKASLQVGDDTKGGYAVPETLDLLIERYERDNVPMRGLCASMTLSNEKYTKLVSQGTAGSGWVGETEARTETTTPTLAELVPYFGEIYAEPRATQTLLDDSAINIEQWLADEVGYEFSTKENSAFLLGNGVKKPKGILSHTLSTDVDGTRAFDAIQKVVSGSAGAFVADKLIDLVHALHANYRTGARFMTSNLGLAAIRKLKDGQGNYLWQPDFATGPSGTLLSYPVTENEAMPTPAADANALLFANFQRAYTIYDVRGVRVLRDEYTAKPYIKFYTTKRVGGRLIQDRAVKVLTLSA